jgi:tetratricopeptide (TPR) repeat protein
MKTQSKLLAILIVWFFSLGAKGQSADSIMYATYLSNSETLWQKSLEKTQKGDSEWDQALSYYGILFNTVASKNEALFKEHLDPALELLESLEETKAHGAEAKALRSSIYGYIMAFSPWKGMYYGPKSSSVLSDALEQSPESPLVQMVNGSSLFYTPSTFGGDKEEAEKVFQQAVKLYEDQNQTRLNWLYLNTLAYLGQAYAANGKTEMARATYKKALAIEPQFYWVSKSLLPQLK